MRRAATIKFTGVMMCAIGALAASLLAGRPAASAEIAQAPGSAPAPAPSSAPASAPSAFTYHEIVEGDPKAKLTVVEYASLTCPHCAHFATTAFPELKKDYIDTGKIRYIFRDLPTPPRELAMAAAQVVRCLPANRGMSMIEMLYKHQQEWMASPDASLRAYAQLAGMNSGAFDACLKNDSIYKEINAVVDRATTLYKVESTPTFFVGEEKVQAQDLDPLKKAIDKALAK